MTTKSNIKKENIIMKITCNFPKLLAFSILWSIPIYSISQNLKVDSLKSLLPTESIMLQADVLYSLAYEYVDLDFKSGLRYAREAFAVAKRTGDSLRIVKAGRLESLALRRLNKIDSSLTISVQILPIAKRNHFDDETKSILNGLALAYTFKAFGKWLQFLTGCKYSLLI